MLGSLILFGPFGVWVRSIVLSPLPSKIISAIPGGEEDDFVQLPPLFFSQTIAAVVLQVAVAVGLSVNAIATVVFPFLSSTAVAVCYFLRLLIVSERIRTRTRASAAVPSRERSLPPSLAPRFRRHWNPCRC